MRVLIDVDPYGGLDADKDWNERGLWPCKWVGCPEVGAPPFVTAYRRGFDLAEAATIRVHVTADERYELFVDGARVGRGSERGDAENWYFETYDLRLEAGAHAVVARVWSLGNQSAYAQMSVRPGFLFSPEEAEWIEQLGTGVADWEVKLLDGYTFIDPITAWGTGANLVIDGERLDWGFERGEGWAIAIPVEAGSTASRNDSPPVHRLKPATLPPMLDAPRPGGAVRHVASISSTTTHDLPIRAVDHLPEEAQDWQALLKGDGAVTIPSHTRRRVLIDLQDYVCAYPELTTTGGADGMVRVHWQESLYSDARKSEKDNRDEIESKYFVTVWHITDGIGDTFKLEGGAHRVYYTLWWQCGRYVEIVVETAADPLTLERFILRETRYPLEMEGTFDSSDARLADVTPLALRTLQMCAHETYMDCPYFEQLMYIGDTRLQALTTYTVTADDRLPRKALRMFDASRMRSGLTQSRYPTRVNQVIPPFSLWWVAMIHDYARWRDDPAFIRSLMPGARGVIDHFLSLRNADGLLQAPDGWNYMDWVPAWASGIPPDGMNGVSGVLNWQLILVLGLIAELEAACGEPELALRAERQATEMARQMDRFWNEEKGLFADDLDHSRVSEHSQCLAILSHRLDSTRQARVARTLLEAPNLERTTIYFTHYLFETYAVLGRTDALMGRLSLWLDLKARGLNTAVEMPEPTRSDCHAWGAHPLYHYYASILGIRPGEMGFHSVRIAPQLGPLSYAHGILPHPQGRIEIALRAEADTLTGTVTLPKGIPGKFVYGPVTLALQPGSNTIRFALPPGSIAVRP